jgi:hypothetical protein
MSEVKRIFVEVLIMTVPSLFLIIIPSVRIDDDKKK